MWRAGLDGQSWRAMLALELSGGLVVPNLLHGLLMGWEDVAEARLLGDQALVRRLLAGYAADHDLIVNPLVERGYLSIGCAPCTRPVEPGADRRSGRWAGVARSKLVPWVLGETDLGDDVLEIGPGPGITTEIIRTRAQRMMLLEIDPWSVQVLDHEQERRPPAQPAEQPQPRLEQPRLR